MTPPPPPEEIFYVEQPVIVFDDPVFAFVPPPPPPVFWLPPVPIYIVELPPPPPPIAVFVLPAPVFVPIPVYVRPPLYVIPPPRNIYYENIHNEVVINNVTNVVIIKDRHGKIRKFERTATISGGIAERSFMSRHCRPPSRSEHGD